RVQGRGGLGIRVAKLPDDRGHLVGAAVVAEGDEILVVMEKGKVVRSRVAEVPAKGRTTMGVTCAKPDKRDHIALVTTSAESEEGGAQAPADDDAASPPAAEPGAEGTGPDGGGAGTDSGGDGTESGGDGSPVSEDVVDGAAQGSSAQPDVLGSD